MTDTDDLRWRLVHITARTMSDQWARQMRATWTFEELCTADQAECETKAEHIIDALMPVVREALAEAVLRLSEVERERDQAVQRADRSDALLDLAKRDRFALLTWLRMNVGAYPHKVMIGREAYDLHEATRAWPERSYAVTGEADAEHDRFEPEVQP